MGSVKNLLRSPLVLAITLGTGGLLLSCSLHYDDFSVDQKKIPQMVLENFQQTSVQNGTKTYSFAGTRAEKYDGLNQLKLQNIQFQEFDGAGTVITRGQVDQATIMTQTNDAEIPGQLEAWSDKQKASLSAKGLSWKQNDKTLATTGQDEVLLKKDSGSTLRGRGLKIDFRANQLSLSGPLDGEWKPEGQDGGSPASHHSP